MFYFQKWCSVEVFIYLSHWYQLEFYCNYITYNLLTYNSLLYNKCFHRGRNTWDRNLGVVYIHNTSNKMHATVYQQREGKTGREFVLHNQHSWTFLFPRNRQDWNMVKRCFALCFHVPSTSWTTEGSVFGSEYEMLYAEILCKKSFG